MEYTLSYFGQTCTERVEKVIADLQMGKGFLLVDDENRENEGDLIYAADHMEVTDMALMIRECSGIVCLCMNAAKAASLELEPMVQQNTSKFQTAFTVSIEAKEGVTTGVSAADRLQTIRTACAPGAVPGDLSRPGHVFPLIAQDGGVLSRRGHTEGSVEMMKLAGLTPISVLCEVTLEDGTMARLPEIIDFAVRHQLTVLSIEDICQYLLLKKQRRL